MGRQRPVLQENRTQRQQNCPTQRQAVPEEEPNGHADACSAGGKAGWTQTLSGHRRHRQSWSGPEDTVMPEGSTADEGTQKAGAGIREMEGEDVEKEA